MTLRLAIAYTLGIAGTITVLLTGPPTASRFAAVALPVLPWPALAWLAYLGRRNAGFRGLTVLAWLAILMAAAGAVWMLSHAAALRPELLAANAPRTDAPFRPGAARALMLVGVGLATAILVGLAMFAPRSRRIAARFLPIDADSFVHATALAAVTALTLIGAVPLIAFGEPPMLRMVRDRPDATVWSEAASPEVMLAWLAVLVPASWAAVGWPIARTAGEARERTGLVGPPAWQIVAALAGGAALAAGIGVVKSAIAAIWQLLGWPTTDAAAVEHLFRPSMTLFGALAVGVAAGLGEELAVRGVLQPRLGLFASNLLFTALHALQYQADALAVVFLLGCGLGLLRARTSVTVSAIVHGTYDAVLLGLAAYGVRTWGGG